MAQANKVCKICQKIGHSRFYCREKGFKPIKYTASTDKVSLRAPSEPKPTRELRKVGKYAKLWNETKKEWKKVNPADESGYRYCKIGGAHLVDKNYSQHPEAYALHVCHDISRARSRMKAYEIDNLFAGCPKHNRLQGSKSLEEFLSDKPSLVCGGY